MKKTNLSAKKRIHNFYLGKLKNPRIKKIYSEFEKNIRKYIKANEKEKCKKTQEQQ